MTTRIPRPLGTTNLVKTYRLNPTPENKQMINEHIVNCYINNGFTHNHKKVSVDELVTLTGIAKTTILMNITRASRTMAALANPEQIQDTVQAMMGMVIQNSMSDRGEIQEQLFLMKASQGGEYKAFISSEVGKTLKLMMESNKNMMDVVKTITGDGKGTNIQINNNTPELHTEERIEMMTTDKAVMLISDNQVGLKDNQKQLDAIFQSEGLLDTPICDARKQTNVDGDKEGLNLMKLTESTEVKSDEDHHDTRRENELEIEPNH